MLQTRETKVRYRLASPVINDFSRGQHSFRMSFYSTRGRVQEQVSSSVVGGVTAAAGARDAGLLAAVRDAFMAGMHAASFVAAGATLLGAVIVAIALPARARTPRGAEPSHPTTGAKERGRDAVTVGRQ